MFAEDSQHHNNAPVQPREVIQTRARDRRHRNPASMPAYICHHRQDERRRAALPFIHRTAVYGRGGLLSKHKTRTRHFHLGYDG